MPYTFLCGTKTTSVLSSFTCSFVIQYFKSDTARTLDGLNSVVSKNYDDTRNDGAQYMKEVEEHKAQKE